MSENLKINVNDISSFYRIGKTTAEKRPILVKLKNDSVKQTMYRNIKSLAGMNINIDDDLPCNMREIKSKLLKARRDAINRGENVKLTKRGSLMIDKVEYVINGDTLVQKPFEMY